MSPYYYNELPSMPTDEGLVALGMIILGIFGVVLLFALAFWIISSLSLHKIAKRRGIRHAWMAWIPIGSRWILGSVSDQYQHLVQSKVTSRRKILLILDAASVVVGVAYVVFAVIAEFMAMADGAVGGALLAVGVPYLLFVGIIVAAMVFYHICNYDLYRSCKPESAVIFLVLGIILPVCQPFFYLACRKKDLGMVLDPPEQPRANPEF